MRWRNIPIPEANVISLMLGIAMQIFLPLHIFAKQWIGHAAGWPILVLGLGIAVWAVSEVRQMDIEKSDRLVTTGPYAFSRNPMYLAWTIIQIGIALLMNSIWPGIFLVGAFLYTHIVVIQREECTLQEKFGDEYEQYRDEVRRYL
jgi:protein-S-isoprenylcysteine O-methyltransferase Ste14